MSDSEWLERQAARTFQRLQPRIALRFAPFAQRAPAEWQAFNRRLENHFPRLFQLLLSIYGSQYDFFYFLEELIAGMVQAWLERPIELKALDALREKISGGFNPIKCSAVFVMWICSAAI